MKELELKRGEYRAASLRVTRLYLTGGYFKPLHLMAVATIGLADVALCLNAIERKSGSVTAGRARSALSSMFTWAAQQGLMGENPHNPVILSKRPKDSKPREHVLTDDELAAIWHACEDGDYGRIIRLAMLTACRREEIGGLRWSEIVDDVLTLPGERVKNGHEHKLPLLPMALEIIATIPERVGRDHLFGDRYSGHRSGVAGTYNRSKYERQIRAALALWADHVQSIVEGQQRKILPFPASA